jgi:recombination protein RecT
MSQQQKTPMAIIHEQRDQFVTVASDPSIEFEREAQFALQIIDGNTYMQGMVRQNPNSLKNAIINVAAIGISLNPASKLAYLVPRDGKVCLDISYMGMMHLAQQTGAIQWGQANLVREGDVFELRGIAQEPIHKYSPFSAERNLQPVVGAYSVVKTDSGDFLTECMSIDEIHAIRDRSSAWKAWISKKTKCPWVTDEGEMIKKTVLKRAAKCWPRRDRLDQAIHHVNTDGGEGFTNNMGNEKDVTPVSEDQITAINDILNEMNRTWDQLSVVLQNTTGKVIEKIDDLTQDEAIKVLAFLNKRKAA